MHTRSIIIAVLLLIIFALSVNLAVRGRNSETARSLAGSFEECERQGNPVAESYPRQCTDAGGTVHVEPSLVAEPVVDFGDPRLTVASARDMALEASVCTREGTVGDFETFDFETGAWRFSIKGSAREFCSPACVVYDGTGSVEFEWRCEDE